MNKTNQPNTTPIKDEDSGLAKPDKPKQPKDTKSLTQARLLEKVKLLEPTSKEQRNDLVCALIGHSRIRSFSWGYNYCGRCDAQLGDSLGGAWKQTDEYIEGHDDKDCLLALAKMGWKDKLYVPKSLYTVSDLVLKDPEVK